MLLHLQRSREANKEPLRRNEELAHELEGARKELDQIDNLRCNICKIDMLNTVTLCGHVYCKPCLAVARGGVPFYLPLLQTRIAGGGCLENLQRA